MVRISWIPLLVVFMLIVSGATAQQNNKTGVPFDFVWRFALNDQPGAERPEFDDSKWRLLDVPSTDIFIRLLGKEKGNGIVKNITLLDSKEKISWKQQAGSFLIAKPKFIPNDIAVVFKIEIRQNESKNNE